MELTKQYFDQHFKENKEHFDKKLNRIDKKVSGLELKVGEIDAKVSGLDIKFGELDLKVSGFESKFATKEDLKAQTKELKEFAEEQTDHLARIIATTVAEPLEKHLQETSLYEEVTMGVWKQLSSKHKRL